MIQILPLYNDNNLFEEIYKDMLNQFPMEELKSKKHFKQLLKSQNYIFSIACSDKTKIGYLTYANVDSNYIWVDYYAIYKEFQSKGFGSKVLKKLFEENKNLKGCFFEVEPINMEKESTTKRRNFYKRLGCTKLDFTYRFPNKDKDLPLELFYMPINNSIPSKNEIAEQIEKVFDIIHFDVQTRYETIKTLNDLNLL